MRCATCRPLPPHLLAGNRRVAARSSNTSRQANDHTVSSCPSMKSIPTSGGWVVPTYHVTHRGAVAGRCRLPTSRTRVTRPHHAAWFRGGEGFGCVPNRGGTRERVG